MGILADMHAAAQAMKSDAAHWEIGPGAANALAAALHSETVDTPIANGSILYGYPMTLVSRFEGWDLALDRKPRKVDTKRAPGDQTERPT